MRCRLLRPGPGERIVGVLLGGLSRLRMHWHANVTYPCWEGPDCPYCPGRPDKIAFRWYGPAAEFSTVRHVPTEEEYAIYKVRRQAGERADPPTARNIHTITGIALAEVYDAEAYKLGDANRRGMVLEWNKGPARQGPIKVKVLGHWSQAGLMEAFDWEPFAETILNNGMPFRSREVADDPNILQMPMRKQA